MKRLGISVSAFAREMGVTPAAVRDRVKRGSLAEAVLEDGSLDHVVARAAWFANSNPNRMKKKPPREHGARLAEDAEESQSEYRLKLKRMAVDLEAAEINLEKLRRSTVDRDDAVRAIRSFVRVFRDGMTGFADRFGPEIAADLGVPAAELISVLDARMRDALTELANTKPPADLAAE